MRDKSRMAQAKVPWQRRKLIAPCSTLRALECGSFLRKVVKRKRRVTSDEPPNAALHLPRTQHINPSSCRMTSALFAVRCKRLFGASLGVGEYSGVTQRDKSDEQ